MDYTDARRDKTSSYSIDFARLKDTLGHRQALREEAHAAAVWEWEPKEGSEPSDSQSKIYCGLAERWD